MLLENDKCVIHRKDGSKKFVAAVQMTKKWIFPFKIETCFNSQFIVAPPKKVSTIIQNQHLLKACLKIPPSYGI